MPRPVWGSTITNVNHPRPLTPPCPQCSARSVPLVHAKSGYRAAAAAAAGDLIVASEPPPAVGPAPTWSCTGPGTHQFAPDASYAPARTEIVDAAYVRHTA